MLQNMTAQEIQKEVSVRIKPVLDELGFEGFLIVGYIRDSNNVVSRSVMMDHRNDPMVIDGLNPMMAAASVWSRQLPPVAP